MPTWMTPNALEDVGVVGLVLFLGLMLAVAIGRRWLIPGGQHREIVAIHTERRDEQAATIATQRATIATQRDTIQMQARTLESVTRHATAGEGALTALRDLADGVGTR